MLKKYGLRHGDKVKLITRRGEMITYLDTRGRNKCPSGLIYTTLTAHFLEVGFARDWVGCIQC